MLSDKAIIANVTTVFDAAIGGGLVKNVEQGRQMIATLDSLKQRLQGTGSPIPSIIAAATDEVPAE